MEKIMTICMVVLALGLMVCSVQVSEAAPMGTAFTYQGRLIDAGSAADGEYDFQFSLWNDPCEVNDVNQLGDDVNIQDLDVIDGYFTVLLDFNDANAFNGEARWLEIGVRPDDMNDPNAYTELSPRQEVTPAPYALRAESVSAPLELTASAPAFTAVLNVKNTGDGAAIGGQGKNGDLGVLGGPSVGVYGASSTGWAGIFVGDIDVQGHIDSSESYKLDRNTVLSNAGTENIFVGKDAGVSITTGNNNSAVGDGALTWNNTGSQNSAVGDGALTLNTTGNQNSAIGYEAGFNNSTGSGNVFIGYQAGYDETGSGKLYIDNSGTTTPLIYGDFSTKWVGINRVATANTLEVGGSASKTEAGFWLANSDARIKADIQTVTGALETLDKVRLVSFRYSEDYQAKHPSIEKRRYLNVIAQEFRQVFPGYVKSSKEKLANGEEILQVDAYPLTVYSAAAVQELHEIVKEKDAEIAEVKARLAMVEAAVGKLDKWQEGGQR